MGWLARTCSLYVKTTIYVVLCLRPLRWLPGLGEAIILLDGNSEFEGPLESPARVVHAQEAEEDAEDDDGDVVDHHVPEMEVLLSTQLN